MWKKIRRRCPPLRCTAIRPWPSSARTGIGTPSTPHAATPAAAHDASLPHAHNVYLQTAAELGTVGLAIVMVRNVFDRRAELATLRRYIVTVHDDHPIVDLFNLFLAEREQIALVVDEFGGMAGIVTMEDVIETLLGVEIVDESDHTEDMQLLARRNWERRARRLGLTGAVQQDLKFEEVTSREPK